MSKKGCKLECPEENPRIYLKGFETNEVPSVKQGVNERTPKDSTHYHSHLETTGRWRIDTVVAQGWATFSVPNTGPDLLMPFCIAAV